MARTKLKAELFCSCRRKTGGCGVGHRETAVISELTCSRDNYSHVIHVAIQWLWSSHALYRLLCPPRWGGEGGGELCGDKSWFDSPFCPAIPTYWPSWRYVMMHISTFITQEVHSGMGTYIQHEQQDPDQLFSTEICLWWRELCGPLVIVIVILYVCHWVKPTYYLSSVPSSFLDLSTFGVTAALLHLSFHCTGQDMGFSRLTRVG